MFAIAFAVCFHGQAGAYAAAPKSYYDVLGVKPTATAKQIKCAYRLTDFHTHFKNIDDNDNNVNTTTQETSGQIPSRQTSGQ